MFINDAYLLMRLKIIVEITKLKKSPGEPGPGYYKIA